MREQHFGTLNDQQLSYVADIEDSGRHLLSLIGDILDLSKIEAGKAELDPGEFVLHDLLTASVTMVREMALRHGLEVSLHSDVGTGLAIRADELKVKQIVVNLLSNAVKFTPQGGKITVSAEASKKNTTLKIADTGKGIPANKLPKLTDPFTRVGGDPYLAEPGWGLGLTITKSLVDLHDGTLDIKSIVGKGTTVTVTLPNAA